ncbi:MAG: multiheme c-type cytochrome [Terracidiphilus sp.]
MKHWPGKPATPPISRTQHSRKHAWRFLLLLPALCSLAVAQDPTPVREADAQCARCHAKIYGTYLSTPMANASGLAIENLKTVRYLHRPSNVTYSISTEKGQATLVADDPHLPDGPVTRPLTYFLGSGHLGVTYLYSVNDYMFESPVAWYAASGSYDMKPGLADMREMPPAIPIQSACLRCHMSSVQASVAGAMNRYQGPAFLHTGITCESCHGDSIKHTRSGGKERIVNPMHLDAERRDSVCISCHLEGDVSVEHAGTSASSYRAGASISTYLSFYVRSKADPNARGVSEVEQLSQSTCKRRSGDAMSCMSCHDPHFTPGPEQRVAFYRKKCLACHAQPAFAAAHHPENQDCTSCHMPRTGAENIPHVAWTDHRILRLPAGATSPPNASRTSELVSIFSPNATQRDLGLANYKLLLDGDRSFENRAFEQLSALQDSIADDQDALDALGTLRAERGDLEGAEQVFRRVLVLDPVDLTALSNLGILLAKQGNLAVATQLLRKAFDNNSDIPGLAVDLARVECAEGEGAAARATVQTALVYSPALEELRKLGDELKGVASGCAISGNGK